MIFMREEMRPVIHLVTVLFDAGIPRCFACIDRISVVSLPSMKLSHPISSCAVESTKERGLESRKDNVPLCLR